MPFIGDLVLMIIEAAIGLADAAGEVVLRRTWRWKHRLLAAVLFLLPLVLVLSFVLL